MTKTQSPFLKTLIKQGLKGRSLIRTLHNYHLSTLTPFTGKGIDFGAKNATSPYYKFIDLDRDQMTYTDLYSQNTKTVKSIDFEKDFDLSDEQYDFALAMNVLEHIYNHQQFLNNIQKSLTSNGRIEGFVPFLHYYHKDPDDYFRYTHTALARMLEIAGFSDIKVTPIGIGGFTISTSMMSRILKFKPLITLSWLIALGLDKGLTKIWPKNKDIYCGLSFSARKK